MKSLIILIVTLLPVLVSAHEPGDEGTENFPQQMSGRKLLDACASSAMTSAGRERRKYCSGFVSGVEEALRHLKASLSLEAAICVPQGTSAKALANSYIRFAANKQAELDQPAAELVRQALVSAYPCQPDGER